MSESANNSQPSNTTPKTPPQPPAEPVEFKAKDIGIETAKPQDTFAKQRKEAEKHQQKTRQTRKILIIVFSVIGGLALIGLIVWLVIWLVQLNQPVEEPPVDSPTVLVSGSDEEILDLRDAAQDAYDETDDDLGAADAVFEEALQNDPDAQYANQIRLSQLMFYFANNQYDLVREHFDAIDPAALSLDQQSTYYNIGSIVYSASGDTERADEYLDLVYQLSLESGTGQGGYNEE